MATEKDTPEAYSALLSAIVWQLYEVQYRITGALALLERSDRYDERDKEMLGTTYMLSGAAASVESIAGRLSETEHRYVLKQEAVHG